MYVFAQVDICIHENDWGPGFDREGRRGGGGRAGELLQQEKLENRGDFSMVLSF